MRSLEYLMQLYPNKTAKQILAIQAQEKLADKKAEDKRNKKALAYIKDINTNGGYYKGKFGFDQYYYYRLFNLRLEFHKIMIDVETITLFCNTTDFKNLVTKQGEIHLERRTQEYKELDNFIGDEERVTVKEWNELNHYINAMEKLFWK
jgi:hypothetical protein